MIQPHFHIPFEENLPFIWTNLNSEEVYSVSELLGDVANCKSASVHLIVDQSFAGACQSHHFTASRRRSFSGTISQFYLCFREDLTIGERVAQPCQRCSVHEQQRPRVFLLWRLLFSLVQRQPQQRVYAWRVQGECTSNRDVRSSLLYTPSIPLWTFDLYFW